MTILTKSITTKYDTKMGDFLESMGSDKHEFIRNSVGYKIRVKENNMREFLIPDQLLNDKSIKDALSELYKQIIMKCDNDTQKIITSSGLYDALGPFEEIDELNRHIIIDKLKIDGIELDYDKVTLEELNTLNKLLLNKDYTNSK